MNIIRIETFHQLTAINFKYYSLVILTVTIQINSKMKTKDKIQNKISNLENEVNEMAVEVRTLVSDQLNTNYPKVRELCENINIACNQIETLKEL